MTRGAVQAWFLVHKWTSLACTLFLLLLCVTGLPMIFAEEIGHLSGAEPEVSLPPHGARPVDMDTLIGKAMAAYPGNQPLFTGWYEDGRVVYVNLGPRADTPRMLKWEASLSVASGARAEHQQEATSEYPGLPADRSTETGREIGTVRSIWPSMSLAQRRASSRLWKLSLT